MQREVSSRVQSIHCQLTGPAIAGRPKCLPRTTDRSDFAAGVSI